MPATTSRRFRPLLLLASIIAVAFYFNLVPSSLYHRSTMSAPRRPLRLAIFECDTPQPQTRDKFGGYGGVFTNLLERGASTLEPPEELAQEFSITSYDVVNDIHSYPALEDIDAVLITGSRHNAFDNDPWIIKLVEYTKRALDTNRVRVVGVCFGHQIVGRAAGAGVGKSDKGWEVAVTDVDLTDKGKEIFGLDKMSIHQMHRDIVQDFPEGAIPLGSNAFCEVQSMYHPNKYITVQGHPEFTNDIISEILFIRHTVGIFDDELYDDGMKRAPVHHDGVTVARSFLKFMREG